VSEPIHAFEEYEARVENALWAYEVKGQLEDALNEYRAVETDLAALSISPDQAAFPESQRVLAYCLMRQGNILRQMGQTGEALELDQREIAAARASGDELTLARSLMSYGTNLIVSGQIDDGLSLVDEARSFFEAGESDDFKQGLGWYWILQADLANAGLINLHSTEVVQAANRALTILTPLENWPGTARAYAARAQAYEKVGNDTAAVNDRQEQRYYEEKTTFSQTGN